MAGSVGDRHKGEQAIIEKLRIIWSFFFIYSIRLPKP